MVEVSFIGGENHDLPHVTDKVYHIMLYLVWAGFELTTLVVIGTDWVSGSFALKVGLFSLIIK
jgi:hypothetical protein